MKRLVAWILMLCMVMSLLCGCDIELDSSNRRSDRDDDDDEEIVEDRDDEDRDDEDLDDEDRDDEDRKDKDKGKDKKNVTIDEVVVYDENDVTITITGLKETSMGQEVKVRVENNTDRNVTVSGDYFVVNGITIDGFLFVQAAAGKKANGAINFDAEDLEIAGIEHLATVNCVEVKAYDSDSYDDLFKTSFIIETSIADEYEQVVDYSGEVIFEEAGVTVISKGIMTDPYGDVSAVFLVINETGKDVYVEAANVSVNGYTVKAWMFDFLKADTVRISEMTVWNSTLEENDIDKVEDISFNLVFRYSDEWSSFCESDVLTFTFD